jgi:hypothetical protein
MRKHIDSSNIYRAEEIAQIACNLLTDYSKSQQTDAVKNMPESVLHCIQKISLDHENYEFCQVVKEVLERRNIRTPLKYFT